jgi:hypothetical protein
MPDIDFQSLFQQNKYVFIVMGILIVVSIAYNIIRMCKMKTDGKNFLLEHPGAARVFLSVKVLITSDVVMVHSVDGEKPVCFSEGIKTGFYAVPGSRHVEISYAHSRPGFLHKNVITTVGPVKKEITINTGKSYLLAFDRKEEKFTFEEL